MGINHLLAKKTWVLDVAMYRSIPRANLGMRLFKETAEMLIIDAFFLPTIETAGREARQPFLPSG